MELEVKGCIDCPFNKLMGNYYYCGLIDGVRLEEDGCLSPVTPSCCPLKTEPVIITLKEN